VVSVLDREYPRRRRRRRCHHPLRRPLETTSAELARWNVWICVERVSVHVISWTACGRLPVTPVDVSGNQYDHNSHQRHNICCHRNQLTSATTATATMIATSGIFGVGFVSSLFFSSQKPVQRQKTFTTILLLLLLLVLHRPGHVRILDVSRHSWQWMN